MTRFQKKISFVSVLMVTLMLWLTVPFQSIFAAMIPTEQAATALSYRGIRMVIAVSFSQTYKRNAFNNGFPVLECPELVSWLEERHGGAGPYHPSPLIFLAGFATRTRHLRLGTAIATHRVVTAAYSPLMTWAKRRKSRVSMVSLGWW